MLTGALLSLMVAGAGWMWRKPAEKEEALGKNLAKSRGSEYD
jgi:hypothetical protein